MIKAIETSYKGYRFRSKDMPTEPLKRIAARADHTGKKFGRALVVELLGNASGGFKWWGLVCECGTRFAARSRELAQGDTKSCGCLQRENQRTWGGNAGHNKLPSGAASGNELLASYKKSARDRGLVWQLSNDQFFTLVSSNCTYCGTPPSSVRKPNAGVNGGFVYSGVDRIDSAKGYLPTNSAPCCWDCNRAKGTLSAADFAAWIARLIAFGESGSPKRIKGGRRGH